MISASLIIKSKLSCLAENKSIVRVILILQKFGELEGW